jgi:uncharacterized membrane protein
MKKWFGKQSPTVSDTVKRNIDSIAQLEQEFLRQRSTVACLSDRITDIAGSPLFITAHVLWFAGWVLVNTFDVLGIAHFDPYPFCFLALCLASEAALLSTFVLMSQKRQTHQADQWAHVGLQISLLAEQETTKMLQLLQSICNHLGLKKAVQDRELREMVKETHIVAVMQELEKAREADEGLSANPAHSEEKRAA